MESDNVQPIVYIALDRINIPEFISLICRWGFRGVSGLETRTLGIVTRFILATLAGLCVIFHS